jgi:hypothetical protein
VGLTPTGQLTNFQEVITPFHSIRPALPGRTPYYYGNFAQIG